MSLIIADSTPPAVSGITRQQLLHRVGLATGLLVTGTVSAGAINYLEDSSQLKSGQYSPKDWIGGWVRISQTTDNAAPETEIKPVVKYEPELGRVTVEPFFSAAPDVSDLYELWKVNPQIVLDIIDEALTEDLIAPTWSILSEVPDFDMEQDNTDYWAASNATVTKQTTGVRVSSYSKRYLRVVSTAANGYAESVTLNVEPGKAYHMSALARVSATSTTAKLQVYDKTNSTEIASITSDRLHPLRLVLWPQIPSNCYQISIRLITVESGKTTEWDQVCAYSTSSNEISAPWWVDKQGMIKGVFELEPWGIASDKWDPSFRGEQDFKYDVIPNAFGTAKFTVRSRRGVLTWPLFCYGLRHETAYSDDNTDIKYIDSRLMVACTVYKIYKYLSQPLVTGILGSFDVKSKLPIFEKEYRVLLESQQLNLNQILNSRTPDAQFIDERFTYGQN